MAVQFPSRSSWKRSSRRVRLQDERARAVMIRRQQQISRMSRLSVYLPDNHVYQAGAFLFEVPQGYEGRERLHALQALDFRDSRRVRLVEREGFHLYAGERALLLPARIDAHAAAVEVNAESAVPPFVWQEVGGGRCEEAELCRIPSVEVGGP